MLISVGCFAAVNLMVKFLPHLPATELVLFRSLITFLLSYTLLKRKKVNPWGRDKKWLLIRGIAGTTALTMFFYTIQKMPLSAAVTVQYLSPFFTAFIAGLLLGERTRWVQWLFFVISFIGIVVVKGSSAQIPPVLLALGVISSMFSGLAYNSIRKLKNEEPLVVVMYFPLVAFPIMVVFSFFNWVMPHGTDWILLIGIGLMTQFAQLYMTKSYQLSEVNTVAPLKYIGVLFALTWDILLFDFIPNVQMYVGILLVIGGVVLNLRFKHQLKRRTDTTV
ncbi:MAG: EamA family transporter [Bacteroidetes bacterium]|jgi:drug/metabolite transporter (DMT)-like permease|nr:MAG: EamA family transporter [Bacteroidota bacterium]